MVSVRNPWDELRAKCPIELPGVPDVLHHWLRAALSVVLKHCWLSSLLSDVSRPPHPQGALSQITAAARRWPSTACIPRAMPSPTFAGFLSFFSPNGTNTTRGHCSPGSHRLLKTNLVLPSPGYLLPCLRAHGGHLGASASLWQLSVQRRIAGDVNEEDITLVLNLNPPLWKKHSQRLSFLHPQQSLAHRRAQPAQHHS